LLKYGVPHLSVYWHGFHSTSIVMAAEKEAATSAFDQDDQL